MPKTRTALFDLDGTLLAVNTSFFLKHYMDALFESFAGLIDRHVFDKALLGATYETVDNLNPAYGNLATFAEAFAIRSGLRWESVWPKILQYYADRYPDLRKHISPNPNAAAVVQKCIDRGWRVVLATQPLFPEVAIRERMKWCGIDSLPWHFISTLDNMHFCKPHLEYYREIADSARLDPTKCVMVGNDMQEDMVAKNIGMKTFLVENFLIDNGKDMKPDRRGSLADVPDGLDALLPT